MSEMFNHKSLWVDENEAVFLAQCAKAYRERRRGTVTGRMPPTKSFVSEVKKPVKPEWKLVIITDVSEADAYRNDRQVRSLGWFKVGKRHFDGYSSGDFKKVFGKGSPGYFFKIKYQEVL